MAQTLRYKRPRRLNVVTISLLVLFTVASYLTYQYLPLYLKQQEAYRVLEERGSEFMGRRNAYLASAELRESLRRKMTEDLRRLDIQDPELETWIEVDESEVRIGAVYSEWLEWPFDIIERQEKVYELEHVFDTGRS